MGKTIAEFVFGAIVSFLTVLGLNSSPAPETYQPVRVEEAEVKPVIEEMDRLELGETSYRYAVKKVGIPQRLKLFPNFVDKRAAQNLREIKQCQFLVNGGFYSEEFKPLGWLVVEGSQLSEPIKSPLLDGFFGIDQAGKPEINWQKPEYPVRVGLQSGPMLVWQSSPLTLQIKEDQQRRRMVLALTQSQEIIFLAITGDTSVSSGPYLTELPKVVVAIGNQLEIPLQSALNLDGGSASAFLTDEVQLDEVRFVGSYFCVQ